jgi:hypothetical protein
MTKCRKCDFKPNRLVDFSDPSSHPNTKLTEAEMELLNKTSMFEDFVVAYTNQVSTLLTFSSSLSKGQLSLTLYPLMSFSGLGTVL